MKCYSRHRFLFTLVVAGTSQLLAGVCSAPPSLQQRLRVKPTAETYEAIGDWFGNRHQFGCATEAYRHALDLNRDSPKISYLLGLSLFLAGDATESVAPLQQSVRLAPRALKSHLVLAQALEKLGRDDEAAGEWQSALQIDPSSVDTLHGYARTLLRKRQYSKVIEALRVSPDDDVLVADIAQAYMGLKMYDESFKVLNSALQRRPDSKALGNSLARTYMQRFQYQAAEKLCQRTAARYPNDIETQILYLQVLLLTGNTDVGHPLAQKLLKVAPRDFTVLVANGIMQYDAGDFKAAQKYLQDAIAINPAISAAHFHLGLALTQLGETRAARQELQKALDLGAAEPEAHLQLAKVLRTLGEKDAAAEQLKQYQQSLQHQHDLALAASKTAQGDKVLDTDPRSAATFYRDALQATPDDSELNFKLAVALDKSGNVEEERSVLEKAIQLNPDLAPAQNQLGFLYSQAGKPDEAEKHFREAVRAAPSFTEAWVNLAAVLGLQSRFGEARQAVTVALQLEPKNPQALLLKDTLARAPAQ